MELVKWYVREYEIEERGKKGEQKEGKEGNIKENVKKYCNRKEVQSWRGV